MVPAARRPRPPALARASSAHKAKPHRALSAQAYARARTRQAPAPDLPRTRRVAPSAENRAPQATRCQVARPTLQAMRGALDCPGPIAPCDPDTPARNRFCPPREIFQTLARTARWLRRCDSAVATARHIARYARPAAACFSENVKKARALWLC